VLKQKRRELYEVYELAILTTAILSTAILSLTASGEFVVVFHPLRSFLAAELTTLLAMLSVLACLLTLLALLTALATASRCLLSDVLILTAAHVSLLLVSLLLVVLHSVICHVVSSSHCSMVLTV
jgi:hypothetical protein